MITAEHFRRELVGRINEILPEGFQASAKHDGVWLDAPDGYGTFGWAGHIAHDPLDLALCLEAGTTVLNSLQDCVSETLRDPWPMAPKRLMAMPGGRLEGSLLWLWYGDEESPIVQLGAIDLG